MTSLLEPLNPNYPRAGPVAPGPPVRKNPESQVDSIVQLQRELADLERRVSALETGFVLKVIGPTEHK